MTTEIPKYTDTSLQITLDAEPSFPEQITEFDFYHQIQKNSNIKWDVNPYVLEKDCIRIILNAGNYNRWKSMQYVGSVVGTFLCYWGLKIWTYEMLLLLLLIPFTIVALPHLLFFVCIGVVISLKLYLQLTIPLFWIIIFLVGISYVVTKTSDERARRSIIRQAMANWPAFWKYYSNIIIYPDWTSKRVQLKYPLDRYPELILSKKNAE